MKPEEVEKIITDSVAAGLKQFGETIGKTIKGLEDQITSLKQGQEGDRESALRREFNEFLQSEAMQKRIPESQRTATAAHLMTLVVAPAVDFGEGDQKKQVSAVDNYKAHLMSLPEVVQFGEHATRDKGVTVGGMTAEDLSRKAVEFQESEGKAGRSISMTDAVNHVKKGGK